MKADEIKLAKQATQELLAKMGFVETETEALRDESADEPVLAVNIQASPEDTGMLIGFHGESLMALQLLVSQIVYRKLGEWRRIVLNVGDYREKREKSIEEMAHNTAQRVKLSGNPVTLPYLVSSERRLVHLILADDSDIETISEGSGRGRRLTVSLKKNENTDESAHE